MSIGEEKICERTGCNERYIKRTHNQKYHNSECTRLATNVKIMAKYYEDRAIELGYVRYCVRCETTRLSRYNSGNICAQCEVKKRTDINDSVNEMLASVEWVY